MLNWQQRKLPDRVLLILAMKLGMAFERDFRSNLKNLDRMPRPYDPKRSLFQDFRSPLQSVVLI